MIEFNFFTVNYEHVSPPTHNVFWFPSIARFLCPFNRHYYCRLETIVAICVIQ